MNKKNIYRVLSVPVVAAAVAFAANASFAAEKAGVVKQYLMNPDGQVDGLLLSDGTQVHFPPHLSAQLVATVAKNDSVTIEGSKESSNVVRADKISNTKSGKSVVDTPPTEKDRPPMPPPPPHGPGKGPGHGPGPKERMANLKEVSATGTVVTELNGRKGEVNGVILSDDTIVHFGPKLLDDSKVKLTKGSKLKVTGFGTKNDFGQSIEATEVVNQ